MPTVIEVKKVTKNRVITISTLDQTIPKGLSKGANSVTLYFKDATEEDVNNFKYQNNGRDLLIINGDQTVTVKDYFSNDTASATKSKIKYIRYSKGDELFNLSIINEGFVHSGITAFAPKKGTVTGTIFSDTINMENLTANSGKNNKGLKIKGGKGNDVITGTQYNDTITGGVGANVINYDFGKISGEDTIKLTKGEKLTLNLTNGNNALGCEDVLYGKEGKDLIIYSALNSSANALNIKNFFSKGANVYVGDVNLTDYLSGGESVLNIIGIGKINGTKYGDVINGSIKNDTITAGLGNDLINTNGGSDTVVETGEYGHDVIESYGSEKVTVKLSSFDSNNITEDSDGNLVYTTDENSGFVYNDFYNDESSAADLWVKAGNKSYHISKSSTDIDLSDNKNNNVVFMSGGTYLGSKSTKTENIVYGNGLNEYVNQGGNETFIDKDNGDDRYTATLTKSGELVISDNSGKDSLVLNNNIGEISLFYNINNDGSAYDDLVIYNSQGMSYKTLAASCESNSFTGGVKLENYFSNGEIETVCCNYNDTVTVLDLSDWKYYVNNFVSGWLKENNKTSVEDVLLNGTKKEKTALTTILQSLNYGNYQKDFADFAVYSDLDDLETSGNMLVKDDNGNLMTLTIDSNKNVIYKLGNNNSITLNTGEKYSDINLVNENSVLKIFGKDNVLLYTVEDFTGTKNQSITLNVKDDNNSGMKLSVNPELETIVNMGRDNQITFDENYDSNKVLRTGESSNDVLVFTDRAYSDFYTKSSEVIAYNAGDPLIIKDGNDLKIGNTTIKNIDGLDAEIMIKDKNDETKNIIIGADKVAGTFESEIIVGSNSADIITTNGGNDLIYMGDGNDVLNVTALEKGDPTGKNTAQMTGIGGTTTIPDDLKCPALSVYDNSGNDTYNTSFEFGLYIEDYSGNDTLNIQSSDQNIMYFFDVANPNNTTIISSELIPPKGMTPVEGLTLVEELTPAPSSPLKPESVPAKPIIYTDLMICDKGAFSKAAGSVAMQIMMGRITAKAAMESLQGKFGYAWIDDYYSRAQKIETVNLVDEKGEVTKTFNLDYTDETSDVYAIAQSVASWLSTKDYTSAWDVLEHGSAKDMASLLSLYMS